MRHRIYVDIQAAQSLANAERGIARYSTELVKALLRVGAPVETIALNPLLPNPVRLPQALGESGRVAWNTRAQFLADAAAADDPLAYLVLSPMETQLSAHLTIPPFAMAEAETLAMVFYDLIPLIFADRYLPKGREREPYLARLQVVKQADLLFAISERTREDLIHYVGVDPDRCVSIGGGVSDFFRKPLPDEDPLDRVRRAVPAIDRPFVLTVAGWEWRKNVDGLIAGFAAMPRAVRSGLQLVVACAVGAQGEAEWRSLARDAGLADDQFVVTGFVNEETLLALYQSTELFVFPSRYEGYGLPVIEAARCGAAIVTSASSSLPEILALPSSTFPPEDADAMAEVMTRALIDSSFRTELHDAADRASTVHTWDNVARRVVDAFERVEQRIPRRRRRSRRRPRVGFAGPFAPAKSGVAVYNSRLIDAMGDQVELHLFAEETPRGWRPADPTVRIFPIEALGHRINPWDYDLLIYTIGNSTFHLSTHAAAKKYPGVTWLHDVNLVGLHLVRAEHIAWEDETLRPVLQHEPRSAADVMRSELNEAYGDRASPHLLYTEPTAYHAYVDRGALLAASVARRSKHLIVNSSAARDMLARDLGPGLPMPPCTVLPLAVTDAGSLGLPAGFDGGQRGGAPLIVSLGIVDEKKRPADIIEAAAALRPSARVAFVGPCHDGLRSQLVSVATRLGMHDQVEFTGHVDFDEYGRWLARADCAVMLRTVNFGESSGAVADAIGAGLPVLTNVAACRDLPTGVVEMVDPEITTGGLAEAIQRLLDDDARRARMRAACHAYAEKWRYKDVAGAVTDLVLGLVDAR